MEFGKGIQSRSSFRALLLAFVAGNMPAAVYAATSDKDKEDPSSYRHATPHHAPAVDQAASAHSVQATGRPELLTVKARPYRSQIVSIDAAAIQRGLPGTNPMKALGMLPGVMFQGNDAQGIDTWSAQIMMHGFQQQEIGLTLDGIPLGEMTYRNYNGLNPIQAIASENVERMDVSRSAGAEMVAASNNLGGSINYVSTDPKDKMGGTIAQTFGSNHLYHTFIRFDSGKLNKSGTKFFTSYTRNDAGMWKGWGELFTQQVNAKLVQPIGESSSIKAFFDWEDLHENGYSDYSFQMLDTVGYDVNPYQNGHFSGYQTAFNVAKGIYPGNIGSLASPKDAAYYSGGTNINDYLGGLTGDFQLTNRLKWTTTVYGHGENGQTSWASPYFPSPNGSPLSDIVKEPSIQRFGIVSALHYVVAHNNIGMGVWYENNHYVSSADAYSEPNIVNGQLTSPLVNDLGHFSNPFTNIFSQTYNTNTFTAFVNDTYHPVKNLDLHFGFKSVLSTTRVGNGSINYDYYGSTDPITSGVGLTVAKPFLPHIGVAYRFLPGHEIFIDISENVHTYAESGYHMAASPFAVSQPAFNATRNSLRPETAWTYAIGYKFNNRYLAATAYGYRTNFNNRLQQITSGSEINPVSTVANVGGVTMNGVDAGLTVRPIKGLELYNSVSYNHATYDQNITEEQTVYNIKGKQVVNYPKFMYKARLSYTRNNATIWIDASYTGARNYSYTGDIKAPAYWMSNLGAEYKLSSVKNYIGSGNFVKGLTFSFSINNLTNQKYISTMGENGNPLSLATGAYTYQSFLLGPPRQFFGTVRGEF